MWPRFESWRAHKNPRNHGISAFRGTTPTACCKHFRKQSLANDLGSPTPAAEVDPLGGFKGAACGVAHEGSQLPVVPRDGHLSVVATGISIGAPKFPLGYECVYLRRVAPWGLREIANNDEFAKRYRARLDEIGSDRIAMRFAEISTEHDGRGLALLCFEPVGQFCHRRVFADWFEEQTGQFVPELEAERQSVA